MTKEPLIAAFDRAMTDEDLAELDKPRASKAPALVRLSTRHHRLARMLAEGFSPGQAAVACSYVISRVSILQADPAFKELVAFYRAKVDEQYLGLHERLAGIAETAADIIQDRLEGENADELDIEDLRKLVQLGADRTGHGPSTTQNQNITIGFGARLEAARARRAALTKPVIDVDAEPIDDPD